MYNYLNQERIMKKYRMGNHNQKCIDGRITGSGNCVGFCMYYIHPGFLTSDLRKQHDCIGKQCNHYIEKSKKEQCKPNETDFFKSLSRRVDAILNKACDLTKEYEGLRFMTTKLIDGLACELSYVTISNDYELCSVVNALENETGIRVHTKRLNYSFENAVELIMEKVNV